ncbi:nicotinate-nucleotide adenylyltransferase [Poseidonocella sedimentorum]|uniref:Probable nicotinate-nucleotide adenylyltransferase n=1 Tax=Poseidonocella sedimentorum TaxID=871652 RepID=A0A1I6ELM8_9RHOB|nr:nicotinate-nucleotide adenylyltransferase [Poseidonocella sedimentorum]SFR18547.1 nicotinate-nucleotide adenylyltransferase [Poseidonocella sedimentorum]
MRATLPRGARPRSIGLLGGSFDPAHAGHVHITREALKRFGLDEVWWLVSPGNPLKSHGPAPLARRMEQARKLMDHPRVRISDFEAHAGTRFTAETLAALTRHHRGHRFVWLMGADNLAQFHRWQDWQDILGRVPVGVFARPGDRIAARTAPAARIYRRYMLKPAEAHLLPFAAAPAWCFLNVPMRDESSTAIRSRGDWAR